MIASANRDRKSRRFKLSDFLLKWNRGKRQTAQEQLTLFRAFAAAQEAAQREAKHGDDS